VPCKILFEIENRSRGLLEKADECPSRTSG
jgi:hypothetical protein